MEEKTLADRRREALLYAPKNGYDRLSAEDEAAMKAYCEEYKKFLDNGKTERECVAYAVALAEEKGYGYADYHSALATVDGALPSEYSSDGTHPNQTAYTIMEGIILPIIQAYK